MIDAHTHCQGPEHIGRVLGGDMLPAYERELAAGRRRPLDWGFTPQDYDAAMAAGGVSTAIVFGVRATEAGIVTPNEHVSWFCENTETATIPFMALDPSQPDAFDHLEDGLRRGFRGIKLYPVTSIFDPRDVGLDAFYRKAVDAGLVIMWHMGATPVRSGRLEFSQPLVVDEVARRHPDLTQVIAHMAHPWQRETVITVRKNPRVFADVSGVWARPFDGFAALVRAQEWDVVHKLVFGSDFPHYTPAEGVAGLRSLSDMRPTGFPHIDDDTIAHLIEGDHLDTLGLG